MVSTRFLLFLALFGLTIFLQSCSNNKADSNATSQTSADAAPADLAQANLPAAQFAKLKVESPFENLDVNFISLRCGTAKPQTLRLESGSTIEVPAAAFVDEQGKPVAGQVDLQFREFHNPAEIIASGIPMKVVGENGGESWMQTAGMYEIKGSQNGKPVFVAPGKSLTVNLASAVGGAYDFWKFEPEKGNWDNYGTTQATPNPAAKEAKAALADIERQMPTPPVEPAAFDKSKPKLDFDIDYQAFAELKKHRGVIWQYAGNDSKQDPVNNEWIYNEAWQDMKIEPLDQSGKYQLTLSAKKKKYQIPVRPTLNDAELAAAKVDFQQQLAAYQKKIADLSARKETYQNQQAAFVRSFSVEGFGIFNYDILLKNNENIPLMADFEIGDKGNGFQKEMVQVFLITGDRRSVIKFSKYDFDRFAFNPNADNCLVAVLPGNKIATFSNKEFKQQLAEMKAAQGQRYVFKMNVESKPIESVEEMQKRLLTLG